MELMETLLADINKLCSMIVSDAPKKDIESLAFWIGHDTRVLNADMSKATKDK